MNTNEKNPLKVGLIGCGWMGSMHAEAWMRMVGKATLAAIADRYPSNVIMRNSI